MHYPIMDIQADFEINRPVVYLITLGIMYSVCICSWWWDVHICIYFVNSVFFVDFLIKSSFKKKRNYFHRRTLPLKKMSSVQMTVFEIVARHNVVNWIQVLT